MPNDVPGGAAMSAFLQYFLQFVTDFNGLSPHNPYWLAVFISAAR
jgi:hypothetical protein